jgi:hypothetical protein
MTLGDFNKPKRKTKNKQKENESKTKSSQKFPMPRNYKPNKYKDRNLTFLELTQEMIKYYDRKEKPLKYEHFIANTLKYKEKSKKKRTKKQREVKERPLMFMPNKGIIDNLKDAYVNFSEIEKCTFSISNAVKIPERTGNCLPYLNINMDSKEDTVALKDSGASHSLLDVEEFKKIYNYKDIKVKARNLKMVTPNATTENAIQGEVKLDIKIQDITGEVINIPHSFLLANLGGKQKCIIGYDMLGREDLILGETPKHLFVKIKEKHHAIQIIRYNINCKNANPTAVVTEHTIVKANTTQLIELSCKSEVFEIGPLDNKECMFQPINVTTDTKTYGIIMEPVLTIAKGKTDGSVSLLASITNTNNEDIEIEAKTEVGTLEDIAQNSQFTVSEDDFRTLACNIELTETGQSIENIEFYKEGESEIHTFTLENEEISINSTYNRNDNIERETKLPDGSTRTQLIADVEDILECETYIDPEEVLDSTELLDISMADFSSVPDELKEELNDMLKNEMKEVFSKHKWDIGYTDKIKHDIQTEEGKVVRNKKRPIPYQRLEYAKKAVNTLKKYKLVSPIYNSKWASNLVLVQKPTEGNLRDTTKASQIHNKHKNTNCTWRLTQDLRGINEVTKNIFTATLPSIDEIVNKCRNKVVTQFDVNQAYFTIGLTNSSKEKSSFYLNDMMYAWERMTQGLAGAPHTWMKFMQLIFCDETLAEYKEKNPERGKQIKEKHWGEFLSIYMDDLDIFSDTNKENLNHIHAVLWILKREGCLLNPKKSIFMTTNFSCLGVTINTKENLVSIDKKRAQAILSWPKPSSLLEVMSRIQSLNYLSKNLPKLKEIAYPLMTLLRKKEYEWGEEHQTSWEHLLQLIKMDIRLSIPNDKLEYVTSSDTSKIAVAGNLWNYDPLNGKLYLLGCMSKLLSVPDSLKPPFHKECLALCLNLKMWESYILGTPMRITALCDARGVMWLHRNKEFSNKLTTISLYISQFKNLVIWHIPGTQNQLADIFSRSYHGSAHKTKEDFKLSKNQAAKLPPLTDPCILSSDDLFTIFSSLPESEPDFDRGNTKRRPLPTPKPIINIMKQMGEATPEEKFVSARRIIAGWNDKSINENKTIKNNFNNVEKEVETEYIKQLKGKVHCNEVTLEKGWREQLKGIENNSNKIRILEDINMRINDKNKTEIKSRIEERVLCKTESSQLMDEICPTYIEKGTMKIKIPTNHEERTECLNNMEQEEKIDVSRNMLILNTLEVIKEEEEEVNSKRTEERMLAIIADICENKGSLTSVTLIKLQDSDSFCTKIKKALNEGINQPSFKILNNILVKIEYDTEREKYIMKIVLPDDIMPLVCKSIHIDKTVHQPKTGSEKKFKKYFYNKQMKSYIQGTIDRCVICKYTEKPTGPAPGPGKIRTLKVEDLKPREALAIDLAVNLPITENMNCHALTVVCLKTNYGQIYPLKTKTAKEVSKQLENGWIKHYHAPKYIYADIGSEFDGEMRTTCLKYGIKHYSTFPHSHQGNRSELLVKAFKNNMKKLIYDYNNKYNQSEWDTVLPVLVPKINQSIIYSTKTLSRELLFYGDEINMPALEIINNENNYFENRDIIKDNCIKNYDIIRSGNKKYYKPAKSLEIEIGDIIFIQNRKEEYPKSLKLQYSGPMRVTKVFPLGVTCYHVNTGYELSAHFNHIKKMNINQFDESMPKGWTADIKKHILKIKKARTTNKIDLIFEEEEDGLEDNS